MEQQQSAKRDADTRTAVEQVGQNGIYEVSQQGAHLAVRLPALHIT
jgi:hypothetical protein